MILGESLWVCCGRELWVVVMLVFRKVLCGISYAIYCKLLIEYAERAPEFPELVQISKQLFGVQEPQFKYEDDEKDLVTIASSNELREAVTLATKSSSVLRIFLFGMSSSPYFLFVQ